MGKIVKAVAVIGIAAAIAIAAPGVGAFVLNAFGAQFVAGSALALGATAFAGTALSLAAGLVMNAIGAAPGDTPSAERLPSMRIGPDFKWHHDPPAPPQLVDLQPIKPRFLDDPGLWGFLRLIFWPGQRFGIVRASGDCMRPIVPAGGWFVIDRRAPIRPGDLFFFGLSDMFTHYHTSYPWLGQLLYAGMGKRYLGMDGETGRIIFECTNPPMICDTSRSRITHAYCGVGIAKGLLAAVILLWRSRWVALCAKFKR